MVRFCFVLSVFIHTDCNRRGQTSRPVAWSQIQTSYNFEKITHYFNCVLDLFLRWWIYFYLEFCYNDVVSIHIGTALCLFSTIFAYTKIFLTLRHSQIQVQSSVSQGQRSQAIPALNIARYRKAVYSALWVQITLVICYLPFGIAVVLISQKELTLSSYLAWQFTITLVYLNSSLNPLLYCWRIREVRQAVKETLRQLFGCLSS